MNHAKNLAEQVGRPYEYRQGWFRKELFIQDILRRDLVSQLTESKIHQGRHYAGFNPARSEDVKLFQAVLSGSHEIRGFQNSDVRNQLYRPTRDRDLQRRRVPAVTGLLKRLQVRGLIAKIPRTGRWRLTSCGHSLLGVVVRLPYEGLAQVI